MSDPAYFDSRFKDLEMINPYAWNRDGIRGYITDWTLDGYVGVLEATIGAIDRGLLTELSIRIASEIYSDVLDEAERLLKQRQLPCAAMLSRVGLESGLRRLGARESIQDASTAPASVINQRLRLAGVYALSVEQQVNGLLAIGNAYLHNPTAATTYTAGDIAKLIADVRHFLGRYNV